MAKATGKSKGAIERTRARAARERGQLFKKRSQAAKKGWETRKTDREGLFERMVKWLTIYRKSASQNKRAYSYYRMNKRFLYEAMGEYEAEVTCHHAGVLAGWDVESSMKFARLS